MPQHQFHRPEAFEVHGEVSLGHEDEAVGGDLVDRRDLLLECFALDQQDVSVLAQP